MPAFPFCPQIPLLIGGEGRKAPTLFSPLHIFCSCYLRNVLAARPVLEDLRRGGNQGLEVQWGVVDLMEVSGLTQAPPHRQHPGHLCSPGGGNGAAMSLTTHPAWGRAPVLVPQPCSRLLHCTGGPSPGGQAIPRPWEIQKGIQAQTSGELLFVAGRVQGGRCRTVLVCCAGSAPQVPELEGV